MSVNLIQSSAIGNPREKYFLKTFGGSQTPTRLQHPHDIYCAVFHEPNSQKCQCPNPLRHRGSGLRCESHKRGFLSGLNPQNNKLHCVLRDNQRFFSFQFHVVAISPQLGYTVIVSLLFPFIYPFLPCQHVDVLQHLLSPFLFNVVDSAVKTVHWKLTIKQQ